MDLIEELNRIRETPNFAPENMEQTPGVMAPKLTPEQESVGNAFSVMRQQIRFNNEARIIMVDALLEVLKTRKSARNFLGSLAEKILWGLLSGIGFLILGQLSGKINIHL